MEEANSVHRRAGQISIIGLSAEDIGATIANVLRSSYGLQEAIDRKVEEAIDEKLSEVTEQVIRERVTAAIDAAVSEGLAEFDRYTGKELSRKSISAMVQEELTRKYSEGGYGNRTRSAAEHAVERAVGEIFDKQLKGELDKIKADLKKQADEVFKARLVASMREAIGLR